MVLAELHIEDMLPATLTAPGLNEAQFLTLCERFPDAMCEYTADGTFIALPPNPPGIAARGLQLWSQLYDWAKDSPRSLGVGPGCGFLLASGAAKRPDLIFPLFAPEFVIELRVHHSRLAELREKMDEYIANGVQLAWLIDPFERTVAVYRPGRAPELLANPASAVGEGFVLDLARVFA